MPRATIDRLIVNSPSKEPAKHWRKDRQTRLFELADGRRPVEYVVASSDSKAFDDPGVVVEIPLVNRIRLRIRAWRDARYPGITGITKRPLILHGPNASPESLVTRAGETSTRGVGSNPCSEVPR